MNSNIVIKAESLTKKYVSTTALDNFSLDVRQGEFVALLGANGAGNRHLLNYFLDLNLSNLHHWVVSRYCLVKAARLFDQKHAKR